MQRQEARQRVKQMEAHIDALADEADESPPMTAATIDLRCDLMILQLTHRRGVLRRLSEELAVLEGAHEEL